MSYSPTTDPEFLSRLELWLRAQPELLVLFRYSVAAGSRDFEFFSSFQTLSARLHQLPPRTCVLAFREPQLPMRGVVNDAFIAECLRIIPDGSEYLVVETALRTYGRMSWFHYRAGESHSDLLEDLMDSRGAPVAAGLYPPWMEGSEDVTSAIVPDENGIVTVGVY